MGYLIEAIYFLTAVLFITGLKRMSHPNTARSGIIWAGYGMILATVISFFHTQISINLGGYLLMILAIIIGGTVAWYGAKKVAMTAMPQMIAIYNGMGGGAAAAIAAIELIRAQGDYSPTVYNMLMAVSGAMIGAISFSGSIVAFGKLQELKFFKEDAKFRFDGQQKINAFIFFSTLLIGILLALGYNNNILITIFFLLAISFGAMMALPIGGADMPVIISMFNAFTGLAVALEGYVIGNSAMIIAGIIVGSSGTLLTLMMAKAMNRSVSNVLFSSWSALGSSENQVVTGSLKSIEPQDAAIQMAYASKVVIVPGYGMAVAQAQHKIWEMSKLLIDRGIEVKFAIHPVAGRMPGHMNVLLAEAGVPYDIIFDMEEINEEFQSVDVALVIGANDVVNPAARKDKTSPIYGMPILNVDHAKNVQVIKRGKGVGFAGIENSLFFADNTRMVYGDAQKVTASLIQGIKEIS